MIKDYRQNQYQKNCDLIDMIMDHKNSDEIVESIGDVICGELDLTCRDFLRAYQDGDADAMVCAVTGWNLESLLAKAKVIPDVKHNFYATNQISPSEIAFPRYGKDEWTEQEFMDYLREEFTISVETLRLIQNVFTHARQLQATTKAQQDFLWAMLQGTIGLEEDIVRKVVL